jgi:hypothetical protein
VISERQFSTLYTSFWSTAMPLGDAMVRAMNLRLERFAEPLDAASPTTLNGFVNELAFRLAESSYSAGSPSIDTTFVHAIYPTTEAYIMRLPRAVVPGNATERAMAGQDALALAETLLATIRHGSGKEPVCFRPKFSGCGIHDDCEGDILIGEELWEVKSGDRQFRLTDVRQILIYCALNHFSMKHGIKRYRLVNPRVGVMASGMVRDLSSNGAGCEPQTLFEEIIDFLSLQEVST